jgi:hypothetical protein
VQLRVLGLGLREDRDVGVGVFPQREEILIRRAGLSGVAGERIGAGEALNAQPFGTKAAACYQLLDNRCD